jgi:hypothetical protein
LEVHVTPIGAIRNVCRILTRKPKGKNPLVRPRGRLDDIIKRIVKKYDMWM